MSDVLEAQGNCNPVFHLCKSSTSATNASLSTNQIGYATGFVIYCRKWLPKQKSPNEVDAKIPNEVDAKINEVDATIPK